MSGIGSQTDVGHCATVLIDVPAQRAFGFLADPIALGTWSLGCMRVEPTAQTGVYTGFSLYDDGQVWFDIHANRELLLIDYRVGEPAKLKPRIMARVVPAECCDLRDAQCYVSLIAWRPAQMTQDRWNRLCTAHEAEIWLIKARLEGAAFASDRAI
jgi:hypothetical protein